ncbi:MAG: Uma2 family endonuclease [Bacteroidia bacterium]
MGFAQPTYYDYTAEQYFEIDGLEDQKFEYYLGDVYSMAGTTTTHNTIAINIVLSLANQITDKCRVYMSDVRLEVKKNAIYFYPDVVLTCEKADLNNTKGIAHPSLIVEVLSPSTETKDLNEKLDAYTQIPTVLYYMLVGQTPFSVKLYERANHFWAYTSYTKEDDEIHFAQLGLKMRVKEIYKNV